MNRVEELILAMENYVDKCKTQAFSNTKITVDRDAIKDMIKELRALLPEELTRVQRIMANKDAILDSAQNRANEIINDANNKAKQIVMETQIVTAAKDTANSIINQATDEANQLLQDAVDEAIKIRSGALSYTDGLLDKLEGFISKSYEVTRSQTHDLLSEYSKQLEVISKNRVDVKSQLDHINDSSNYEIKEELEEEVEE